ncbi:MAG: acetyltransferase [Bacteroidota bacterium]
MKRLAIIGSGDLGELIAYHATNDNHFNVVGFFDDFGNDNTKIMGKIKDVQAQFDLGLFDYLMIGIGYKHMKFRKELYDKFKNIIPFGNVIHSSSYVDSSVSIGEGVFILPGCTIDKHVILGNNVLLNTSVVIAHDSTIMSHCFISPAASIAGKTIVEECCIIGINATLIDNLKITEFTQIAGGAVVIDNINKPGLYTGVPAKFKKNNNYL